MARKAAKKTRSITAKGSGKNMIVWVRLPAGTAVTAANAPRSAQLTDFLKRASLNPRAGCFGGDTCIV